ncbi:MAG: hypothetical protein Q9201_000865 [Fulgogasparrea decipioides]
MCLLQERGANWILERMPATPRRRVWWFLGFSVLAPLLLAVVTYWVYNNGSICVSVARSQQTSCSAAPTQEQQRWQKSLQALDTADDLLPELIARVGQGPEMEPMEHAFDSLRRSSARARESITVYLGCAYDMGKSEHAADNDDGKSVGEARSLEAQGCMLIEWIEGRWRGQWARALLHQQRTMVAMAERMRTSQVNFKENLEELVQDIVTVQSRLPAVDQKEARDNPDSDAAANERAHHILDYLIQEAHKWTSDDEKFRFPTGKAGLIASMDELRGIRGRVATTYNDIMKGRDLGDNFLGVGKPEERQANVQQPLREGDLL